MAPMIAGRIPLVVCALLLATLAGCVAIQSPTQPSMVVLESESSPTATPIATDPPAATAEPSPEPTPTPTLAPGLGCLSGQALTISTSAPVPGTTFYLAPALGGDEPHPPVMYAGPDPEQGHIVATTGPQGEIDVREVPPGRYYLAMWAPYDWVLATVTRDDDSPLLISIDADTCTELGGVWFPWP